MTMKRTYQIYCGNGLKQLLLMLMILLGLSAQAQTVIDIRGSVYGGARQADVGGSTFVNIGADHHDVLIGSVYGGNDISGRVGSSTTIPKEFEDVVANGITNEAGKNNNQYSAFVRISPEPTTTTGEGNEAVTTQTHHIFIGNVFGGGNGDYDYTSEAYSGMEAPVLGKAYLELKGGTVAYVYGGGNNATVTAKTDICIDNLSQVTTAIPTNSTGENNLLKDSERLRAMGISALGSNALRDKYHYSRVFGGNNLAEMRIQPTWHLNKGKIDNLYSGGNAGRMTSPVGLLLEIDPKGTTVEEKKQLVINNVYGGCRKADVHPLRNGAEVAESDIQLEGYKFPAGFSARLLVRGGDINNVYGGNDISGRVYGGNAVGIYSSVNGDVYGGGNGSYPYTDKEAYKETLDYGDYYYEPGSNSVEALNDFRPNAEQVSLRLYGTADKKTVIGGAVYVGGNSATLASTKARPKVELKIGSYVVADKVFLGNNGANMVNSDEGGVLRTFVDVNSMDLTDATVFAKYMESCAMPLMPSVTFDSKASGDPENYIPYSTYIGSLYCGGNVGSMVRNGKTSLNFKHEIIVYNKVVGGCNNANVPKTDYNARYEGGILGSKEEETGDKLELNFEGLKIQPLRWVVQRDANYDIVLDEEGNEQYILDEQGIRKLEFNTFNARTGKDTEPVTSGATPASPQTSKEADVNRRFAGGNIYGGCYNSGHVNGNVIININSSIVDRKGNNAIFDKVEENEGEAILYRNKENKEDYKILERHSGVILNEQGMDVLGSALNVFGGGFGEDSEIWGSTTINVKSGYVFQIFGGGEKGAIGKGVRNAEGKLEYSTYDSQYSTYINLAGAKPGVYRGYQDPAGELSDDDNMAEAEFVYGGGFFGPIVGDTHINLGNGRIFNTFAGSCNGDILGHTETYIGRSGVDADGKDVEGFPWVRDHVYGGNDLGGRILNTANFKSRVNTATRSMVYNPKAKDDPDVLKASAYMEYLQGRVDYIFGGCYGYYDYKDRYFSDYTNEDGSPKDGFIKPRMENAFVNFKPINNARSAVAKIYGAGQGYSGEADRDVMQDRSYVLIDIPQNITNFNNMEVFGAGDYSGIGMRNDTSLPTALSPEIAKTNDDGVTASAVIDLARGQIYAAYGASFKEGVTRRTIVNVPKNSTIYVKRIFGGAYGLKNEVVCDVYEANVNYHSNDAVAEGDKSVQEDFKLNESTGEYDFVAGAVYGGNNSFGRTFYSRINIDSSVLQDKATGYSSKVFGGGYGEGCWSQYTEVNLLPGASVYEVYGGGYGGRVLNKESVKKWQEILDEGLAEGAPSNLPLDIAPGYEDEGLNCYLVRENPLGLKTNTNVYIHKDAKVWGYCYGGGYGATAAVSGTTFIGLLGGTVSKDIYGGGTSGAVQDLYGLGNNVFVATTNVYVQGGSARNVYGGSWEGSIGRHDGDLSETSGTNIDGKTNVVIGILNENPPEGYGYYNGVPAIQRNAYGGGEGGAVFGTANLTINNGYIGYVYNASGTDNPATAVDERYEAKLNDETYYENGTYAGDNRLEDCGNAYGGGYDDNSSVDFSNIYIKGGWIRNSVFGGGEIATIGRGAMKVEDGAVRELKAIYKHGKTHIEMYKGHVLRNVYGGGKGYNKLGYGRKKKYYTDGYVFGQTEVYIRGGEIGTVEGLAENYGNVFGGGDIGYVYGIGVADKTGVRPSPDHYYYKLSNGQWSEDCKVVVEPYAQVINADNVTIGGTTYNKYDYVPTDDLNKLRGKDDVTDKEKWDALDASGVIIRNAVFGGGNVAEGSDKVYANAVTVFGNVTASLRDVYRRDLITIGTEHVGGLYGGGNLSLVNGYRELHVSNYGTDYYGLQTEINMEQYAKLTDRERAYFRLRYTCLQSFPSGTDTDGIAYKGHNVGDQIFEDEYNDLPDNLKTIGTYWNQDGVCSIYAGRLLNTIQRADLCGVYGSRMVLQGARDRVPDQVDYTRYTINRVGELSLKKVDSPAGETDDTNKTHGNYFGIYNVVNFLGNLTSDVLMTDNRKLDNITDTQTYHDWKAANPNSRTRNTATCHNEVALASGVFLELTTEESTEDHKQYGYITGVIELDLINAKADEVGGGYVYAKNEHGKRSNSSYTMVTLSPYNTDLRSYKMYTYSESAGDLEKIQTSGNFVHDSRKTIIDDCYPNNMEYAPGTEKYSEAHYWYVKGSIYIYDMELSAYTGSPSAYSKEVHLPLTITPGSHGQLKMVNVKPNLYAYYADNTKSSQIGEDGVKVDKGRTTYYLNDVITYWDWSQLDETERELFVPETMVSTSAYKFNRDDATEYAAGVVMLPAAYETFKSSHPTLYDVERDMEVDVDKIFHSSNNVSHDKGYVLSLKMDTPTDWSNWYSPASRGDGEKIKSSVYNNGDTDKSKYTEGPTFYTTESGVYGQRTYTEGQIIPNDVVSTYTNPGTSDQAVVTRAYVASESLSYTYEGHAKSVNPGAAISTTEYNYLLTNNPTVAAKFKEAKMCTTTLKLDDSHYLLYGNLLNADDVATLSSTYNIPVADINKYLENAWYCESTGLYGGTSYGSDKNYNALNGWCALSTEDRQKFHFNQDAFDVLLDPNYTGVASLYGRPYDEIKSVEYDAIYNGTSTINYGGREIKTGDIITREFYEQNIPNEQYHYTPIRVEKTEAGGTDYYIAKEDFTRGDVPYAKGQVINSGTFRSLSQAERDQFVKTLHFTNTSNEDVFYFYCREAYTGTKPVTNTIGSGSGTSVEEGWVISQDDYTRLPNVQKDFAIKGMEPTATTTFYVSRESDINDLSKEKIITVIYQYTYNESDISGQNVELANELHIVNIHLKFESGVPIVGKLLPPPTVLPGSVVNMTQPSVQPGAAELIGGGWEIYDNLNDAMHNRNGVEYQNNETPLYWYQNQKYYVAYYAMNYLGKTYSNVVPFTVANYHDISDVMADKDHHMYVDHVEADDLRAPKIYLNETKHEGVNQLDLLKSFFDLSTGASVAGHKPLNTTQVGNCRNLDFILSSNLSHSGTWSPIGDDSHCFEGTLHGDGYTINGLDNSLFHKLCGNVYNLGVTGSFTSAGIVDTGDGYVENCWVKSSAENVDNSVKAVFGNPSRSSGMQVVNCYYPETNHYSETNHPRGNARKMKERDFYNGTVAYNLNGFYLNKRYYDGISQSSGTPYQYLEDDPTTGSLKEVRSTGYYPALTTDNVKYGDIGYVERRFGNEDFIYAGGSIPETADIHQREIPDGESTVTVYAPIWPDDYIFFGQMLTYDYDDSRPHESQPSRIVKSSGRLPQTNVSNRVYRAPAYFHDKNMSTAYFNPYAYLVPNSKPETITATNMKEVYPGMTAVDFAGHNDLLNGAGAYALGLNDSKFYPPLLDDDGLTGITVNGQTQNLLVYAPAASDNQKTYNVLNEHFAEPAFSDYDENSYTDGNNYNRVAVANTSTIHGHLVQSGKTTTNDHLLVDRQDFNCPIAYNMGDGYRMWYQRKPDRFVTLTTDNETKGWENISLPFTAELVTTQDKGEITHFYQGNTTGHEYWLREFTGVGSTNTDGELPANFTYPNSGSTAKEFTNHFLWDYYYSKNSYHDANADEYQKNYYREDHTYSGYPRSQAAIPYLVGFPGEDYYEFDLSGHFDADNTASPSPASLDAQVITFASDDGGVAINVSDDEMTGVAISGYKFMPNYATVDLPNGSFILHKDGDKYEKVNTSVAKKTLLPFRPYFVTVSQTRGEPDKSVNNIIFNDVESSMKTTDIDPKAKAGEDLLIKGGRKKIMVESQLHYTTDVRIVTPAGITLTTFSIQPSEYVETRVETAGVYIVYADNGKYVKKVIVR